MGPRGLTQSAPFDLDIISRGLAFGAHQEELLAALATGSAVVQAPPGSGKTTLAPPLVANLLAGREANRVLVTAPRRIAVRAAAARLGELSPAPGLVGYTIRGERRGDARVRVEFLTPGVLLRRLLDDPGLDGVGAVILDEVHERSLDADLLLGMLTDIRQIREDLLLVAMSATLQAEGFSDLLGNAPIVRSSGHQHPVDLVYRPSSQPRFNERGVTRGFLDHVVETTRDSARESAESDILVFLPGRAEITYAVDRLRTILPTFEVLPLYSGVSRGTQEEVLRGHTGGRRRIVVATNVAESSLTVPGVHVVIDSCLTREVRRDTRRGMRGLVTVSASQAAGTQRAGRAGRLGPGVAYRCVTEAEFAAARLAPTPEVFTAPLATAALLLSCWGAPGGRGLSLPDPLPETALAQAMTELTRLGAVDADGAPTPRGRTLAGLPLEPALGTALLAAATAYGAQSAAEIVALLATTERAPKADLRLLLRSFREGTHSQVGKWRQEVKRLRRVLPRSERADRDPGSPAPIGVIAAQGPGLIARRDDGSFLFETGTRAQLPADSALGQEEWLVVTDVARSQARSVRETGAVIHAAAPITGAQIEEVRTITSTRRVALQEGRVRARQERAVGRIVISTTSVPPTPEEITRTIAAAITADGVGVLRWSASAVNLRGRLAALHAELGEPWPDVSDVALSQDLTWVEGFLTSTDLSQVPVLTALQTLTWNRRAELDRLTPEQFTVPSGRSVRLDYPYPYDGSVRAAVKLQECFGLVDTPRILGDRVPITFELLSPAGRPLAVTTDLEFFWTEVYPQVRAENRARYAKHPWPTEPNTHVATAATKRQLQRDS